jgi:hypothetical protein
MVGGHRAAVVFLPMLSPTSPPVPPPEAEAKNALVATASLSITAIAFSSVDSTFSSADSASTPPSCCRRGRECAGCASASLVVVTGKRGNRGPGRRGWSVEGRGGSAGFEDGAAGFEDRARRTDGVRRERDGRTVHHPQMWTPTIQI